MNMEQLKMNSICSNCKSVYNIRPDKCWHCGHKTFEPTLAKPDAGTITWFKCEDRLPHPKEFPIYDDVKYSDFVLATNGKHVKELSYAFTRHNKPIGWVKDSSTFEPTHWAYINLPE